MKLFEGTVAVAGGGAIGSILRYWLSRWVDLVTPSSFPWGTGCVNIIGCFLAGILATIFLQKDIVNTDLKCALIVGLLGGFTTLSSFSLDALALFNQGQLVTGLFYVFSTIFFSLAATFLGCLVTLFFITG